MEVCHRKSVRRVRYWNFVPLWKVDFVCLFFFIVICGVRANTIHGEVVLETPFRRYIVTSERFMYGFDDSTYQETCGVMGAEMAVIETNAEFNYLQSEMSNNSYSRNKTIYINLAKRLTDNGDRYYWAKEEVDPDNWWPGEPNDYDSKADEVCLRYPNACRRFTMWRAQKESKFKLLDSCCTRAVRGLCVQDNDDCGYGEPCPAGSVCAKGNAYRCVCLTGYTQTWHSCEDVDECSDPALFWCSDKRDCVNTAGTYTCQCHPGYFDFNGLCQDIDECEDRALFDCPEQSTCVNLEGSYTCDCNPGYTNHSDLCTDVDECKNSTLFKCPELSSCSNTDGGYTCICQAGYFTNESGLCEDIDECENATLFDCQEHSTCVNIDGSYTCDCDPGYTKQGDLCVDVDECANWTLFTCQELSYCNNKDGGYTCSCQNGYFTNEVGLCEEIDTEGFKLRTCQCLCPEAVLELGQNLSKVINNSEVIRKETEAIQKKIEVKRAELKTVLREKISATDERASSASFGVIALTLLGLEIFFITLGDIIVVGLYVKQKLVRFFCPTTELGKQTDKRKNKRKNKINVTTIQGENMKPGRDRERATER